MSKKEKSHQIKLTTIILGSIALVIIAYVMLTQSSLIRKSNNYIVLEQEKEMLQLDIQDSSYIGINNKQLIKVTKDGIVAYDLEGEELWSDTLTLDNYIVRQREPYIAVANKMGKTITLFSDKGKQGEIICKNPVAYFSINKNGSVAVIENLGDSHIVSAYDNKGNAFGVRRITYVQDKNAGYPTIAELSPDNEILLASYIDVEKPVLTSTLIAIQVQKPKEEEMDHILYGIEQKDNLVYEIEFVKDNEWISVGDKVTTWYTLGGQEIIKKEDLFPQINPYLIKMSNYGEGFLPVISSTNINATTIHRENELRYFNVKGEMYFDTKLNGAVTYFYADDKGVVIGERNRFVGYNKIGNKLFEFSSNRDVSKLFYIQERKKGIAVTRDKVILLGSKRKEK